MAAERLHDRYEQDGDQPGDNRMRRLPSLSTVIREAMMQKHMQTLLRCLEPLIRRVVQEEVEAGLRLMQSLRYMERAPAETPAAERAKWKLAFRTPPQLPIFTGSKIEGEAGRPLEVVLVDACTGSPAAPPVPRALRVELVPVFGDFPPDGREDWAADELERSVVREREGRRPLLTGDVGLTLRDGRATVGELRFTDNSSWVRSRRFRIAARAACGGGGGARVQEAVTEAFVVRDHRGERCRKHYPPALTDDVWRLEKIRMGGVFHTRLMCRNVGTVQEFVRMLMVNPDELRAVSLHAFRTQLGVHFHFISFHQPC
ncbi:Calmodulin-binding protein 60 B [Zea mays]|uniref:Calmodulin-binding protein 60 B n=1 Tax=Zea mays TaxID=4577 RepID=A0A3L6DTZ4_MAIZE|nr:Calmodulin-binding protein 60 B [Zea mays]